MGLARPGRVTLSKVAESSWDWSRNHFGVETEKDWFMNDFGVETEKHKDNSSQILKQCENLIKPN